MSTLSPKKPNHRTLEGKLSVVTGGSRGIGAAIATNLASKGSDIVLGYTSASSTDAAESFATQLSKTYHINAVAIRADLGSPSGPATLIAFAKNHFTTTSPANGERVSFQIDIIINNAGISSIIPLADIKLEDITNMYAVNVQGPLLLVQAALPYLPHDRSGRIVNISSVSAGFGFVGQGIYGGTKAALEAMTRTWSRELAERATVNSVNPGPVAGDMWDAAGKEFHGMFKPFLQIAPLCAARIEVDGKEEVEKAQRMGGRAAKGEEVAGVVGMLCSEESGWCTGSMVCANGGMIFGL